MKKYKFNLKKRVIGLTGGIGTGKSTVGRYLATNYQLLVLDADIFAREAVKPDSLILQEIVNRYGNKILLSDNSLNRQELGNIIFSDINERRWIESKIHPYVRENLLIGVNQMPKKGIIVLVIPLLFEAKMTDLVTEVWVVSCSEAQQIQRLMQRDNITLSQAQERINSQMPLLEKCQKADIILDNSSTEEELLKQVDWAINTTDFMETNSS